MRECQGFTLLEVLLATTVLGVVMAMLTLSLSATLRAFEVTERQEAIMYQAQTALRLITEDLMATVSTPDVPFVGRNLSIRDQRADSLIFPSRAHLVLNPEKQRSGMAVIHYRVVEDGDDKRRLKLLRADTLALPGVLWKTDSVSSEKEEPAFLLAEGLRVVQWKYFDRDGQEFDSWQQGQLAGTEEKIVVPAAVQCTLEFWLDPDKELSQTFTTRILVPAEAEDER
jgi:general secretion pathway protein J